MPTAHHPFEAAPCPAPPLARVIPFPTRIDAPLSEQDRAVIRELRPEALVAIVVTFGSALFSVAVYSGLWSFTVAAGPACGWLFAIACKLAHLATSDPDLRLLAIALAALTWLDLLPIRPLDGHRICAALARGRCAPATTAKIALAYALLLAAPLAVI